MEATAEGLDEMLKAAAIRPPRLEDAGLEDCALPPDFIMEAFSRAAGVLKSRIAADDDEDGTGCVQDPAPTNGEITDELVGETPDRPFCAGGEGGFDADAADEVVVVGGGVEVGGDRVLVPGGEEGSKKSCVVDGNDGVEGEGSHGDDGRSHDDDDDDKPILVEALI